MASPGPKWSQLVSSQNQPLTATTVSQPEPAHTRTHNRKQRRRHQKQQQQQTQPSQQQNRVSKSPQKSRNTPQQWPALTHNNPPSSCTSKSTATIKVIKPNNNISFAALTSSTHHNSHTSTAMATNHTAMTDAHSVSSSSSIHTPSTSTASPTKTADPRTRKQHQQRLSALHRMQQVLDVTSTDACLSVGVVKNRGLINRRVDCYINAIIQSLLSLPFLVCAMHCLRSSHTAQLVGAYTHALYDVFYPFMAAPQTQAHSTGHGCVSHPPALIAVLDQFRQCHGRRGYGQQDAQEFLGDVIASLHDEMSWRGGTNDPHSTFSTCVDVAEQKVCTGANEDANGWNLVTKNVHRKTTVAHRLRMNDSLISTLFGGEFYQMVRYHRHLQKKTHAKPSVSYTPFFMISLDIHAPKISSISAALHAYLNTAEEIDYKQGKAYKSYLMSEAPWYLLLHLKRFVYSAHMDSYVKLQKHVAFDTKLSVSPNLLFDKRAMKPMAAATSVKLKYELRSVIVHDGDYVTHGHYVSYCRREWGNTIASQHKQQQKGTQWVLFDDRNVSEDVDVQTVKSQQAYVLMYQKIL